MLPSSDPHVNLQCWSGGEQFWLVNVSAFTDGSSQALRAGLDRSAVSGDEGDEALRHLSRRPGRQLVQAILFLAQTQLAQVPDLLHRQQLISKSILRVQRTLDKEGCLRDL